MIIRHSFKGRFSPKYNSNPTMPLDYCALLASLDMPDKELAELLGVSYKKIQLFIDMYEIPSEKIRNRIDELIKVGALKY
ncbi:TPA: hypothetical protein ACHWJ6_000986 [Streptococcus suis]